MNIPETHESTPEPHIWAVASGKGGVGKSLISSNLAVMLATLSEGVVAVDMDLGNANMHAYLGVRYPRKTIIGFINGEIADLNEITLDTPIFNLKLIPGAGGVVGSSNLLYTQKLKLLRHIERIESDNIVMDLSAGTSYNTIDFFLGATDHLIVTTPETTAIQSCYNFLRICLFRKLNRIFSNSPDALKCIEEAKVPSVGGEIVRMENLIERLDAIDPYGITEFRSFEQRFKPHLILNMVMKKQEITLGNGFKEMVRHFLNIPLQFAGSLPYTGDIRDSVSTGIPHIIHAPNSRISRDFFTIAESLLGKTKNRSLIRETLRREILKFGKSYRQRIVEPDKQVVDPSVNATGLIRETTAPEKKEHQPLSFTTSSWSRIAIDLGTTYTRLFVNGRGIILNEPSLMCVDENTGKIVALGIEAKSMTGRAHSGIVILSPLESSAITDYTDVKKMIMEFIRQAKRSTILIRPGVILTIQPGLTNLEKRAFREFIKELGAREVHLVYQPMAAAIGAGLPVDVPRASMIVNIGGGSITAIVISISGIAAMAFDKVGGKVIDTHIIRYLKDNHNFNIGEQTAEWIKINHGQAMKTARDHKFDIRGQDIVRGVPDTISISTAEIREAIAKPVSRMVHVILDLLERVPPELAGDLVDRGMTLTGGGALLSGFDRLVTEKTGLAVHLAPNPLTATIEGAGRMLEDFQAFKRFFVQDVSIQD